jgi:hypothetical protein
MGLGGTGPRGHFGALDSNNPGSAGVWPGFGAGTNDVEPTSGDGVSPLAARVDHFHKGVHSVNGQFGDVVVTPGGTGVNSVAAADATIVIGGIASAPTFAAKNVQAVATVAALAALASAALPDGSLAFVQTVKAYFCLVASTQAASGVVRVAAAGNAGHLWERCLESTDWRAQLLWSVDPSNSTGLASDENTGATDLLPLLTHSECARRLAGAVVPNGSIMVVRHLSSDLAGASAVYDVQGAGTPAGAAAGADVISNAQGFFSIIGIPTTVYTGVVSGIVQTARGLVGDNHFTDAGAPPAFSNATGRLWRRTNGVPIGFWPQKDLGGGSFRISCPSRAFSRQTLANGDTYAILQLPILRGVVFSRQQLGGYQTSSIQQCDYRGGGPIPNGPAAFLFCDLTGLTTPTVANIEGATFFGNCHNPFVVSDTMATSPPIQIVAGLCDATAGAGTQQLPASGRAFLSPSSAYLSFQGLTLPIDHGVQIIEGQFSFFDCVDCISIPVTATGVRVEIVAMGGMGNSGKIVNNQAPNALVTGSTQLLATPMPAGMTSDANPFQLGTVVSPTPTLVDPFLASAVQVLRATALIGVNNPLLKFSGTHLGGAAGVHDTFLADEGAMTTVVELTASPAYPMPARTVLNLRVNPRSNTLATAATVTVMKNGVATACTVNIPAGSTAIVTDLVDAIAFAANDTLDVRVETTAAGAGNALTLSAVLELQ